MLTGGFDGRRRRLDRRSPGEGEAAMGKLKGPGSARSKAGGGSGGGRMDKEAKKKWDAHDAKVLIYTRVRMGCRARYSRASSSSEESSNCKRFRVRFRVSRFFFFVDGASTDRRRLSFFRILSLAKILSFIYR